MRHLESLEMNGGPEASSNSGESRGGRIRSLDGLRFVAILMVIVYHFLGRWTFPIEPRNLYPYGNVFATAIVVRYGYLGVQLFFVISGFVIALTLTRCASLREFAVRRFARLWPTMALCAVLTYAVCSLMPHSPFVRSKYDFIPSLTFTVPDVFDFVTRSHHFDWMDGSSWSLFVEVRFYALAGLLYFAQPEKYARNVLALSGVVLGAYTAVSVFGATSVAKAIEAIFIAHYLPWFLFGIGFYRSQYHGRAAAFFLLGLIGLVAQSFENEKAFILFASAGWIIPLVWAALRVRVIGRALSIRPLAAVGAASYSLYLLHQFIGVALIHEFAVDTGVSGAWAVLVAAVVSVFMIMISMVLYQYWEMPLNRLIVRAALARRDVKRVVSAAPT